MSIHNLLYSQQEACEVTLPTGGTATVKEMTGHEQRAFANKTKVFNGMAIQELLANCTESVNEQSLSAMEPADRIKFVQNLLAGDRAALLFGIRIHSLGNEFRFRTQCPSCKSEGNWEVDLSDKTQFPVTPYKLGTQQVIEYDSKVSPGLKIQFKHLDGNSELLALKRRNTADLLTDLELRQIKAHNGTAFELVKLDKVSNRLIDEMRKVIREHEGTIDSTVKVSCEHCSEEVQFVLLELQDFMIPNVTL